VNARDEVLARIRRANAEAARQASTRTPGAAQAGPTSTASSGSDLAAPAAGSAESAEAVAPSYRLRGELGQAELMDLLAGRLTDYRATVRRATAAGLASEVVAALIARGVRRVVVPAGLELPGRDALPPGVEVVADGTSPGSVSGGGGRLTAAALDACDGTVTGAAVAIAETGTIVLDGSPDQGRRAITLVPDYHLCIVRAEQVVQLVPEAVARLADRAAAPLTWISGPSATSDIELERVEGVHGPRTLEVILVG
jgi:L-lactate dehydrogenase complex protein LldG